MFNLSLKNEVKRLRKRGFSLKDIKSGILTSKRYSISKATLSRWCKHVKLSENQIKRLIIKKKKGLKQGRIKGILSQKQKRLQKIKNYKTEGEKKFSDISNREVFIAGLFMYLAGGSKKRISFTNSDPVILKFIVKWFEIFFKVPPEKFVFTVFTSKDKLKTARRSWSKGFGFPARQFKLVKSKQDSITFRVSKSTDLFYRLLGFVYGFFKSHNLSRE